MAPAAPRRPAALVTGVTRRRGIGAAVARVLADGGHDLFLTGWQSYDRERPWGADEGGVEALAAELRAAGARVEQLDCDLARRPAAGELFDAATARFGRVRVLVNNAAHSEPGGWQRLDAAQLDRHYRINLRAPALLCREFARRHQAGSAGRIVNVTSGQGVDAMPGELAYAATKGGLDALTVSLAPALAGLGITVNAVDPGPTDSGWMDPATAEALERSAPLGRLGQPADAARLVGFLASESAGWITGQLLRSRGGL